MPRLCVCGKRITSNFELCSECLSIYGDERNEWPEWLKFWVNDTRREIEQEKRLCDREIVFSDMDDPDNNFEE